jgi:proteasome lid subunit RPN8/RPN11
MTMTSDEQQPKSAPTSEPAPASPFFWGSLPNSANGIVLRPWLTERDQATVQAQFSTKLSFSRVEDDVRGTGTTIMPRIAQEHYRMVEEALTASWAAEGVDPTLRPRHRPQPTGNTAPSPPPPGTSSGPGSTRDSRSSTYAPRQRKRETPPEPKIVFTVNAYLKYLYMCHAYDGYTEVGGYGIHDRVGTHKTIIRIRDFVTVRQLVNPVFCSLDPGHANELMVEMCMADENFNPNQLIACWCHTHPGFSVTPSGTDWDTFAEHDLADWAAMIILDKDGDIGAHIRQRGALRSHVSKIEAKVDWAGMASPDVASKIRPEEWEREYLANIWPSAQEHHPKHRKATVTTGVLYRDRNGLVRQGQTYGYYGYGADQPQNVQQGSLPLAGDHDDDWRDDDRRIIQQYLSGTNDEEDDRLLVELNQPDDAGDEGDSTQVLQMIEEKELQLTDLDNERDNLQDDIDELRELAKSLDVQGQPLITSGDSQPVKLLKGICDVGGNKSGNAG